MRISRLRTPEGHIVRNGPEWIQCHEANERLLTRMARSMGPLGVSLRCDPAPSVCRFLGCKTTLYSVSKLWCWGKKVHRQRPRQVRTSATLPTSRKRLVRDHGIHPQLDYRVVTTNVPSDSRKRSCYRKAPTASCVRNGHCACRSRRICWALSPLGTTNSSARERGGSERLRH